MKIKFLGTGGAIGTPVWSCSCPTCTSKNKKNKRFRSSILVTIGNKNILIDFGQDLAQQLLKNKIKKLDYAFLTHNHADHANGYEQLSMADNCSIEAPQDVLDDFFNGNCRKEWLLKRNSSLTIKTFEPKQIGDFRVETVKLKHDKDFSDTHVPCYGYLFKSKKFSFAYCSDYNVILEPEKLNDLDLIISDANRWDNNGTGHTSVSGAIEIFKKYMPKQMILTHISHNIEHDELAKYLLSFGNILPAYDGLALKI